MLREKEKGPVLIEPDDDFGNGLESKKEQCTKNKLLFQGRSQAHKHRCQAKHSLHLLPEFHFALRFSMGVRSSNEFQPHMRTKELLKKITMRNEEYPLGKCVSSKKGRKGTFLRRAVHSKPNSFSSVEPPNPFRSMQNRQLPPGRPLSAPLKLPQLPSGQIVSRKKQLSLSKKDDQLALER